MLLLRSLLALAALTAASLLRADDVGGRQILFGPGADLAKLQLRSNTERQTWSGEGDALVVDVATGPKATPTLFISPRSGVWDLSAHGHVVATVTNLADEPMRVELRVDNAGRWQDKPWNSEALRIAPGKTAPIKVIFGHHYGYNPGYKLDPAAVSAVVLFIEHAEKPRRYRIDSIVATGPAGETPPVKQSAIRHRPADGYLLGGAGATLEPAQLQSGKGVSATITPGANNKESALALDLAGPATDSTLVVTPPSGSWDLSRSTHLEVTFTNTGSAPVTPSFSAQAGRDEATNTAAPATPIAPGRSATVAVAYAAKDIWQGPQGDLATNATRRGTAGSKFKSDKAARLVFRFDHAAPAKLRIDSIRAIVVTEPLPKWVGKRPPVPGDWKLTLDENFDQPTLDASIWEPIGPNWWGEKKLTRNSRDNVLLRDGHAVLRLEKRPGWQADDPTSGHRADYATGILRSYGKWVQLYGYFEARMKLPEKTALWPAFWLMPDRGEAAGEQWKRQSTDPRGMELDIMEHLTRWGPYRYTTAMHWDGYGKNHKATGAVVYFNPAPDGYVTSGVLWLPGFVAYYVNGREIARWEHERVGDIASEILFTMPIGGWDNEKRPVDAELPADFLIDYVRVWQRADLTPGGKP